MSYFLLHPSSFIFHPFSMFPHPDRDSRSLGCAVITASDTRTPQSDRSGQCIQELLQAQGHRIEAYAIVKDWTLDKF